MYSMSIENTDVNDAVISKDRFEIASEADEGLDDIQITSCTNVMILNSSSSDDASDEQIENTKAQTPLVFNLDAGWDDSAIIRCFDLAIQTHDSKDVNKGCSRPLTVHSTEMESCGSKSTSIRFKQDSQISELDPISRWRPGDLPLPQWAVDPWFAIRNGTYLSSKNTANSVINTNNKDGLEKSLNSSHNGKIESEMSINDDNQCKTGKKRLTEYRERGDTMI